MRKIIDIGNLGKWRGFMRDQGLRVVVTNGCFDVLHAGHVWMLRLAASLGDMLIVGINDDAGVRQLKGSNRPVNTQHDRAVVVSALAAVDAVCVFAGSTATRFLELAQPDFYIKGGDYTLDTLNAEERAAVESCGGQFEFFPLLPGRSSTRILSAAATRPSASSH